MTVGSQFVAMSGALDVITAASWPYRVTFSRTSTTTGTAGGQIVGSVTNATPASVPCRYRPSNGKEIQLAGKTVAGVLYSIFVPNSYNDSLIDVDAGCKAAIAATTGGEPARTFNVVAPLREMGLQIIVLATIEQ